MALLSGYYQKNAHFTIEHHAFYVIGSCSLMLLFILDFSYCFGRKWHKISSSSYLQLTLPPRYPQPKPTSLYTKVVIEKKRSTYQLTIFRDYFLYLRRWWFAVILHQCIFDLFSETSNKICQGVISPCSWASSMHWIASFTVWLYIISIFFFLFGTLILSYSILIVSVMIHLCFLYPYLIKWAGLMRKVLATYSRLPLCENIGEAN